MPLDVVDTGSDPSEASGIEPDSLRERDAPRHRAQCDLAGPVLRPGGKWQPSANGGEQLPLARGRQGDLLRRGEHADGGVGRSKSDLFIGEVEPLLRSSERFRWAGHRYDVTPDGQRFVLSEIVAEEESRQAIHIVMNWYEELRERE